MEFCGSPLLSEPPACLVPSPRPLATNRKPVSADREFLHRGVRIAAQLSTCVLESKEFWVLVQTVLVICIAVQTLDNTLMELDPTPFTSLKAGRRQFQKNV
jgi:hypothetical protein